MDVLIITTYFPPDSAIAAVRPFMFAKYLTKIGDRVTVLRSGLINKLKQDIDIENDGFRVITVMDGCSGGITTQSGGPAQRRLGFLPDKLRRPIKKVYRVLKDQKDDISRIRAAKRMFELQKKKIDQLSGEHFDVVFSTFGELENIYAGKYASRKLGAKWIMDLRDAIPAYNLPFRPIWRTYAYRVEADALRSANAVTTVSHAISGQMRRKASSAKVYTLNNGFDPDALEKGHENISDSRMLRICYTGTMYEQSTKALKYLARALKSLVENSKAGRDKIRFVYAGPDSDAVHETFSRYGIEELVEDHGYVDRETSLKLQRGADVFLVLSWNTAAAKGVITGKFYEGIVSGVPILTMVWGDAPDSELYGLQKKYRYGFCFECCRRDMYPIFKKWLWDIYRQKLEEGSIRFETPSQLIDDFRYDHLAGKLHRLMEKL